MRLNDLISEQKLNELSIPKTMEDARNILLKHGYHLLGDGSWASVYFKRDKNYVLKLFDIKDVAYRDFINLVKANPNKHFPKIYGNLIKVNENYLAVRLEELIPLGDNSDRIFLYSIEAYVDWQGEEDKISKQYFNHIVGNPELKKACDLLLPLAKKYYTDFTVNNCMKREDGTIVITDPFYPKQNTNNRFITEIKNINHTSNDEKVINVDLEIENKKKKEIEQSGEYLNHLGNFKSSLVRSSFKELFTHNGITAFGAVPFSNINNIRFDDEDGNIVGYVKFFSPAFKNTPKYTFPLSDKTLRIGFFYIAEKARGKGLMLATYEYMLNSGYNVESDTTQSKFSKAIWQKLANSGKYDLYVGSGLNGEVYKTNDISHAYDENDQTYLILTKKK